MFGVIRLKIHALWLEEIIRKAEAEVWHTQVIVRKTSFVDKDAFSIQSRQWFQIRAPKEGIRVDAPNEAFNFQSRCTLNGNLHRAGSDE